ncbi:C-type lectin domain family 4 member F-like [Alosa sapidissima]|uniref:C-type lectin domain family 4 member F-like n=2 Tax=Alosa TaxID=34772 RepID=UPI001C098E62|nr:C-type lectin domain family 4 member F-like [Alosa sapidissima]
MKELSPKQQKSLEDDGPPDSTADGENHFAKAEPKERASKRLCVKLIKLLLSPCVALLLMALIMGVLSDIDGQSIQLQKELDDAREEFRTLLKELEEAKRKLENLLKDRTSLSDENTELQKQLDQMKLNWKDLHTEYTNLFRQKTDFQIELLLTKNKCEELMSDHISLSGEKKVLQNQLDQIRMDWEDLKSEYTSVSHEKTNIQVELHQAEKELEDLKSKHETLSEEKTELEHQLNLTQSNWEDVQNLYSALQKEKSKIQTELHVLQVEKNKSCADGWEYFSGKCYFFSYDWLNWTQSRDACVSLGGHLVIIETEEEQVFLSKAGGGYWIGLSYSLKEGDWRWMDNTALRTPKFWEESQPEDDEDSDDKLNEEEDCVIMTWTNKNWDDVLCKEQYKRVCESKAAD